VISVQRSARRSKHQVSLVVDPAELEASHREELGNSGLGFLHVHIQLADEPVLLAPGCDQPAGIPGKHRDHGQKCSP
jgi:hypothetical protein